VNLKGYERYKVNKKCCWHLTTSVRQWGHRSKPSGLARVISSSQTVCAWRWMVRKTYLSPSTGGDWWTTGKNESSVRHSRLRSATLECVTLLYQTDPGESQRKFMDFPGSPGSPGTFSLASQGARTDYLRSSIANVQPDPFLLTNLSLPPRPPPLLSSFLSWAVTTHLNHSRPNFLSSLSFFSSEVEWSGNETLLDNSLPTVLRCVLEFSQKSTDSQWNPVYNAFLRFFFVETNQLVSCNRNVILTRQRSWRGTNFLTSKQRGTYQRSSITEVLPYPVPLWESVCCNVHGSRVSIIQFLFTGVQ